MSDDTADFVLGTQSLKCVTDGAGGTLRARHFSISPVLNVSAQMLRIKMKIDKIEHLATAGIQINLSSSNFATDFQQTPTFINSSTLWAKDNEYITAFVTPGVIGTNGDFTQSSGTTTLTSINSIQINIADDASTAVTVHLQEVALVPQAAAGCISLFFDDGIGTAYTNARPKLDQYDYAATSCIIRDVINAVGAASTYMSVDQVKSLAQYNGWDIIAHADTVANHNAGFDTLSAGTVETELLNIKEWLLANGFGHSADFFAWPKGGFTPALLALARQYFSGIRTFQSNLVSYFADSYPFAEPFRLRQIAVTGGASPTAAATVNTELDRAMAAKKTVILTFHDIADTNASGLGTWYPTASFGTIVDHIASSGYRVKTISEIFKNGVADAY